MDTTIKAKKWKRLKLWQRIIIICIAVIFVLLIAFFIWALNPYRADETALSIYEKDYVKTQNNMTLLSSQNSSDTGFIFYPGANVEASSYLPLLDKITNETGMTCVLMEMPLGFAFFDIDAALDAINALPQIDNWYIGGHSLGASMASDFASNNEELFDGLIVMGAYVYGDYPTEKSLTIYGTFNSSLENKIDYTDNIVIIEGGNHAQFGNYGKQFGDPDATISAKKQQDITVEAIDEFIKN